MKEQIISILRNFYPNDETTHERAAEAIENLFDGGGAASTSADRKLDVVDNENESATRNPYNDDGDVLDRDEGDIVHAFKKI